MRISSAVLPIFFLLAACGSDEKDNSLAAVDAAPVTNMSSAEAAQQRNAAAEEGTAACAVGATGEFKTACKIERSSDAQGVVLTMRQPEGGFHRLRIVKDGRGVVAADGSEQPKVTIVGGNEIEVAFNEVRYRLPATMGSKAPASALPATPDAAQPAPAATAPKPPAS